MIYNCKDSPLKVREIYTDEGISTKYVEIMINDGMRWVAVTIHLKDIADMGKAIVDYMQRRKESKGDKHGGVLC